MKAISPTLHGVIDYLTVGFLAMAPTLFDLDGTYATACYALAAGYLVISLLTNMPLGLARMIPFPMHGKLELVMGLLLLASPWLFGFADDNETARNLFAGIGLLNLMAYFLTDWHAQTQTNNHNSHNHGHTITGKGPQMA